MRTVVILAAAALVALVIALLSGSTLPAVAVVVLAAAGIVLLLRDWRADTARDAVPPAPQPTGIAADELHPDISVEDPSSDSRSDQF